MAMPRTAVGGEPQNERAGIAFGVFNPDRASSVRLDSARGPGTDIDLEGSLGLERSTSAGRIDGHYWFSRRHRIDAAFFDSPRRAAIGLAYDEVTSSLSATERGGFEGTLGWSYDGYLLFFRLVF